MAEWTPNALAAERERRLDYEASGMCPDSGLRIDQCWGDGNGICDCAFGPPKKCRACPTVVWDLLDHEKRRHE